MVLRRARVSGGSVRVESNKELLVAPSVIERRLICCRLIEHELIKHTLTDRVGVSLYIILVAIVPAMGDSRLLRFFSLPELRRNPRLSREPGMWRRRPTCGLPSSVSNVGG